MGGWNSAEYQRSDHNRNEDKGRSASEGMEAKGETMTWCVAHKCPVGLTREVAVDKDAAVTRVNEIIKRDECIGGGYWAEVFVNTWEKINSKEEGSIYIFEEKQ